MASDGRVVWREGLFLRPQHLQQQDRHIDSLARAVAEGSRPYPWGVRELKIDPHLASQGRIGLERCVGVLRDGTPFATPSGSRPPPPLVVPGDTRDATVYLTLPEKSAHDRFDRTEAARSDTRFLAEFQEVFDGTAENPQTASEHIELASPNLQLGISEDQTKGRTLLGVARIVKVENGAVVLDDTYIPPCLDIRATRLAGVIADLKGRADQQIDVLSVRATQNLDAGRDAIAGILMLQALNRWTAVLGHMANLPSVHPERLYEALAAFLGDLATVLRPERRAPPLPAYDHEHLAETFDPLCDLLRTLISLPPGTNSGMLDLKLIDTAKYAAVIPSPAMIRENIFFLAVGAKAPLEEIRRTAAGAFKIGSALRMNEIIANNLRGIEISHAPTPPPQINILPGYVYFELDRSKQEWAELESAPGIGVFVSGRWTDLKLELWWVKRNTR